MAPVEPITRPHLDFFPDALRALPFAPMVDIAGVALRVATPRHIFCHELTLLSDATADRAIDPKHYIDAKRLAFGRGRQEVTAIPNVHFLRAP